jgi:hypothetical protein
MSCDTIDCVRDKFTRSETTRLGYTRLSGQGCAEAVVKICLGRPSWMLFEIAGMGLAGKLPGISTSDRSLYYTITFYSEIDTSVAKKVLLPHSSLGQYDAMSFRPACTIGRPVTGDRRLAVDQMLQYDLPA